MKNLTNYLEWPGAIALVLTASLVAQAQVDVKAGGTTVQVGPDRGAAEGDAGVRVRAPGVNVDVDVEGDGIAPRTQPAYWIGLLGADISPELRSHLNLNDEKLGVIVRSVVPDSPAAAGGLRAYDILLSANGEPITAMSDLVDLVDEVGPTKGQITLEIIRAGQDESVKITPTERPPAPPLPVPGLGQPGFREDRPLGDGAAGPFGLRLFGPGGFLRGDPNVHIQTNGVSVNVTTVDGQTRVKVKRGDQEWDVDANNPEELAKLPDDVRVLVDGVMAGAGANVDINVEEIMPGLEGLFGRLRERRAAGNATLQQQMEEMERQMEALRRQMRGEAPLPEGAPPAAGGEAPPFQPGQDTPPEPAEVEIPAE